MLHPLLVMTPFLSLRAADYEVMRGAVAGTAPEEACGLLGGTIAGEEFRVETVIPTTNLLHSPVRFRVDPLEQLQAFERFDAAGQILVGIYHSHPQGPDHPSETDLAEAYYPQAITLIWSGRSGEWECRAFWLQNGQAHPLIIRIGS